MKGTSQRKNIFPSIGILFLLLGLPQLLKAEFGGQTGYVVGFRESVLKTGIRHGGTQFRSLLGTVLPSSRRRELSVQSLGRLKRNLVNSIARGDQAYLRFIDAKVVRARKPTNDVAIKNALSMGLVRYVTPDIHISVQALPNDPDVGNLWGLDNQRGGFFSAKDVDINAPEAWEISKGSESTVVGVLDTGIDPTHPDLAQNVWRNSGEVAGNGIDDDNNGYIDDFNGCNFVTYDPAAGKKTCGAVVYNDHNHGTHLAGTIGARGDNGIGLSGVAPRVKMISLAFLDAKGSGTLSDMLEGIEYAIALKRRVKQGLSGGADIRVINGSFGHNEGFTQPEFDAFKAMEDAGILFVAAAGNGGADGLGDNNDRLPTYPATYEIDSLVSVAAVGRTGGLAYFSNYGAESVDIAAPGVSITSTAFKGGYEAQSGTSMAAPHVTGVAALLFSYQPKLEPWVVKQMMLASTKDGTTVKALSGLSGKLGSPGMVDAAAALKLSDADLSAPRITKDPKSQAVPLGASLVLTAQAFSTEKLAYRWFKDGSEIAGAVKPSLTVRKFSEADAGSYYCIASIGGRQAQSAPALITTSAKGQSDVNGDGAVNFADVLALFVDMGKTGDGLRGDLNSDGVINFTDLDILLKAIKAGGK